MHMLAYLVCLPCLAVFCLPCLGLFGSALLIWSAWLAFVQLVHMAMGPKCMYSEGYSVPMPLGDVPLGPCLQQHLKVEPITGTQSAIVSKQTSVV